MLLPGSVVIAAENEASLSSYDIGIKVLTEIGVIDEADLSRDPEEQVTRAELAMLAVRLRGWEKMAHEQSHSRYFYDVDADYYETKYINLAAATGLLEAVEEGYFSPAKAVTFETAAKTFVNVLGYGSLIKARGGEAADYIALASQKGLLKGVNAKSGAIVRGDIYKIMANSLDVDVLKETSFGANTEYGSVKDEDLLAEYHDVYFSEGIISANEVSALSADNKKAGKDKLIINEMLLSANEAEFQELLGYNVCYYYKEENSEFELIYAYKDDNESVELKPSDILSFENLKYTYLDEDEEEETAKTAGAYFIYNGKAMHDNDDFVPKTGSVELIDNDTDGTYDVVKIYSYEEYMVSAVDLKESVIKTKTNAKLEIDENDVTIINGPFDKEIPLKEIRDDSIIYVGKSSDGEIVRIITNISFITGAITQMSQGDTWTVVIRDKEYNVSATLKEAIEKGTMRKFEIGLEARFELNLDGEIAYWDNNYKYIGENAWEFGLLFGAETGRFGETIKLRAATSTNQFENFTIDSKVVIDDVLYTDMDKAFKKFFCDGEDGVPQEAPVPQLFRFKLKENGTISHIDLAGKEDPTKEGLFKVATYSDSEYQMWYSARSMSLRGEVAVDRETGVFIYPESNGKMDLSDENKVTYARAVDYLANLKGYTHFSVYKINSDQMAASILCMPGTVEREMSSGAYVNVLLDITTVLNDDGEEVTKLTYAQDAKGAKSAILSKDIDLDKIAVNDGTTHKLKRGDGFRCIVDSFGEITYIQPIYDYENHKPIGKNYNAATPADTGYLRTREAEQFYVAYAYKLKDDILEGVYKLPYTSGDMTFNYNISSAEIYVYDSKTKEITLGSQNDIYDYLGSAENCTKLLMRTHWYEIYQLFIIK